MTFQITSAYNFVPVSEKVVCPDWQDRVSHDLPLEEGLCVELEVELEAHTPLLVGAERKGSGPQHPVEFYKHPDGTPTVPGSSLRGMLRNVLEIATFARLAPVMDDRALSMRDVATSDNDYVPRMVKGDLRKGEPLEAKAKAGWLRFVDGAWQLQHTPLARVEQNEIQRHFGLRSAQWPKYEERDARKGWRKSAGEKQRILEEAQRSNPSTAKVSEGLVWVKAKTPKVENHEHRGGKLPLRYAKTEGLLPIDFPDKCWPGVLVCTGQPGPSKHMEFVFGRFDPSKASMPVPPAVMARFQQVHDDDAAEWRKRLQPLAARGLPVPVFYLPDSQGAPAHLGIAQMFRLTGEQTLGQLTGQSTPLPKQPLDFVQTLFGHVDAAEGEQALKSRIAFGDLRAEGTPSAADAALREPTILGQPKPSFYPAYFVQKENPQQAGSTKSYSTILSAESPKLSGWKRYPVRSRTEVALGELPPKAGEKVQVRLAPLKEGARFRGTVRLHNVQPEEAGALLWALGFGDGDLMATGRYRHALGMGKPFGFGQVSLRVLKHRVQANQPEAAAASLESLRTRFIEYMSKAVANWAASSAVRELLAMADPAAPGAKRHLLTPLKLENKEFSTVKGRTEMAILRPYSRAGRRA
ncbi:MAG: TIGR03986 family CRISPR-associated RAMP protein [Burkholderiales bacterium]